MTEFDSSELVEVESRRDFWRQVKMPGIFLCCRLYLFDLNDVFQCRPFFRLGKFVLNPPGEVFLAFQVDDRVFLGHPDVGVTGDLACLDTRPAHLLPPRDVRAPKRMRPESGEVATLGSCGLVQFLPDS